eukprot:CAMPEP_0184658592 /NCGR_PEP_ID=MMETSP0308-20130426/26047_1 /TAXON_ID=38269 /ORGANISM="Gloeochaete witrockiana, Strain SAG 46.84" /LENGTH=75 /DNA_ID=CAMNT_0027097707 /DNA_START=28 /DNA_END=252 /DNA_ORIENTATION=-
MNVEAERMVLSKRKRPGKGFYGVFNSFGHGDAIESIDMQDDVKQQRIVADRLRKRNVRDKESTQARSERLEGDRL